VRGANPKLPILTGHKSVQEEKPQLKMGGRSLVQMKIMVLPVVEMQPTDLEMYLMGRGPHL
jgi:hypothetical protein